MTRDLQDILKAIADVHAACAAESLVFWHGESAKYTQSPIESALLAALMHVLTCSDPDCVVHFSGDVPPLEKIFSLAKKRQARWRLYPQVPAGSYRLDFLLVLKAEAKVYAAAIECDGHQFHERDKRQAQRDKERDRWLQSKGLMALRFTGSEIWRDPIACARSIVDAIESLETDDIERGNRSEGRMTVCAMNAPTIQPLAPWAKTEGHGMTARHEP